MSPGTPYTPMGDAMATANYVPQTGSAAGQKKNPYAGTSPGGFRKNLFRPSALLRQHPDRHQTDRTRNIGDHECPTKRARQEGINGMTKKTSP